MFRGKSPSEYAIICVILYLHQPIHLASPGSSVVAGGVKIPSCKRDISVKAISKIYSSQTLPLLYYRLGSMSINFQQVGVL